MRIKDVELMTELTRANIRFYEQKGLLKPSREENNYKEYTEKDVVTLKKIVLLRKMNISIDNIHLILLGRKQLVEILQDQENDLKEQIEELNGALELCNCMQINAETIEHMDTEYYLRMILHKEEEGKKFKDLIGDILEDYQSNFLIRIYGHRFGKGLFLALGISTIYMLIINQFLLPNTDSVIQDLLTPFIVFVILSLIYFIIRIIENKSEKLGKIISKIGWGYLFIIVILILILTGNVMCRF